MHLYFYGLEKKSSIGELKIIRPILNLYKIEIIKKNIKNKIPYRIDESNNQNIYERNKVRLFLSKYNLKQKNMMLKEYQIINNSRSKWKRKVSKIFKKWKQIDFQITFFNSLNQKYKANLIFYFINNNGDQINLTKGKIKNIIAFIESNKTNKKEYILSDEFSLIRKNKSLKIEKKVN